MNLIKKIVSPLFPRPLKSLIRHRAHQLFPVIDLELQESNPVERFSVSQAGQDFWVLSEVFNEMKGGYFVDLGAFDGVIWSNSYLLEKRYGWDGVCIEADPGTFEKLRAVRGCRCINSCVDGEEGFIEFALGGALGGILGDGCDNQGDEGRTVITLPARTLTSILDEVGAPSEIDYMSVDIEGAEERVFLNFPFGKYRFKALTIERPSKRLRDLLNIHGYVIVRELPGLDCYFIHQSYIDTYHKNCIDFFKKRFWWKRSR